MEIDLAVEHNAIMRKHPLLAFTSMGDMYADRIITLMQIGSIIIVMYVFWISTVVFLVVIMLRLVITLNQHWYLILFESIICIVYIIVGLIIGVFLRNMRPWTRTGTFSSAARAFGETSYHRNILKNHCAV